MAGGGVQASGGGTQRSDVISREVEASTLLKLKDVQPERSLVQREEGEEQRKKGDGKEEAGDGEGRSSEGRSSDGAGSEHTDRSDFQSDDLLVKVKKQTLKKKKKSKKVRSSDSSGHGSDSSFEDETALKAKKKARKETVKGVRKDATRGKSTNRVWSKEVANNRKLFIKEDDRLIKLLGFEEWKNLILNGDDGLQKAHHDWREPTKRSDNRNWFYCRYCGMEFKDKNRVSFHRYNDECEAWSGPHTLKMYQTFEKNDQATFKVVLEERGLAYPSPLVGRGIREFNPGGTIKQSTPVEKERPARVSRTKETREVVSAEEQVGSRGRSSRVRDAKKDKGSSIPAVVELKHKRKENTEASVASEEVRQCKKRREDRQSKDKVPLTKTTMSLVHLSSEATPTQDAGLQSQSIATLVPDVDDTQSYKNPSPFQVSP